MRGITKGYDTWLKLRVSADCGPLIEHEIRQNHMVATRIQRRNWLGEAVAALVMLGAGLHGIRAIAAEPSKEMEPVSRTHSTQVASSTAGDSSPVWVVSDFAAIALMGLGATIVFLPLPRLRSRPASTPEEGPLGKIPAPGIPDSVQPLGATLSSPRGLAHSTTLPRPSP